MDKILAQELFRSACQHRNIVDRSIWNTALSVAGDTIRHTKGLDRKLKQTILDNINEKKITKVIEETINNGK